MISLQQADILTLEVDAIVNPGNETLLGCFTPGHKCLDHQFHEKAGPELHRECKQFMNGRLAKEGDCIVTKGYKLPAKFVIHVYGPNTHKVGKRPDLLALAYKNCLETAKKKGLKTVCFPAISTGLYEYPLDEAAEVAFKTVWKWMEGEAKPDFASEARGSVKRVVFVTYDERNTKAYEKFFV